MTSPAYAATAKKLEAIASQVRAVARRNGRDELGAKLKTVDQDLADTSVRVVLVGQFKQGKSALVNALVGAPVCPVDDVIATSVPTVVTWGERPTAAIVTEISRDHEPLRTVVDPAQLRRHVTELAGETGLLGSVRAEVTLPSPILHSGFTFVDTPGVGRAQARVSTNLTLLPQADAVLMVTDATQELTGPELSFLKRALTLCPRVACVVSKIDLQYEWRRIVEANVTHLREAGVAIPILANSALFHSMGNEQNDARLLAEAGINDLSKFLQNKVKPVIVGSRYRAIADTIHSVTQHLGMGLEAELRVLGTEEGGREIIQSLQQAESHAQQLATRAARWQQTLSDGAGDLVTDIEFDLRDRLRAVGREAEELIQASDPGKAWDDIGAWLADSITQAVSDNFVWAHQRSVHLADVVAQHFSLDGKAAVPDLVLFDIDGTLSELDGLDHVSSGKISAGQKLMIGLKGSYGGILMFGLMTTLAGMALLNPVSLAAGLVMGGFAYRQDSQQRLEQRRGEARVAVRKLIDETIFQVSKESRDRMSFVKRTLRDHFIDVADGLKSSLKASVDKAKQSAELPKSERERRAEMITRELREVRDLSNAAEALAGRVPQRQRDGANHA